MSWRKNGWRKGNKEPALNPDLWGRLLDLLEAHQVTLHWVKGHAGHPENERCDALAAVSYTHLTRLFFSGPATTLMVAS